ALAKLGNSYLQRKVPTVSEMKNGNNGQQKTVYTVWKTLLDETIKIAQAKQAAVDVYQEVSDKAKTLRNNKLQVSKKCFDNIRKMHEELQQSAQEVDKAKKLYLEEEHMAHEAREKAQEAEEKKEACDIQATKARNDYILTLVAANAHLSRFYEVDLEDLIQLALFKEKFLHEDQNYSSEDANLDCDIYDKIKEYVQLVCRSELVTCATWQSSFSYLQGEAEIVTKISTENNAGLCLSKEARKWASCIAKENRTLRECYEELGRLQFEAIGKEKSSVSLNGERTGTEIDPEVRIEELRQMIRKAETGKAKAEARIEALRDGEVNVDEWLKSADVESLGPHDNLSRTGSRSSRSSQRSSHSEVYDEAASEANESFYDSDFNDDMSDTSTQSQTMLSTSVVDATVPDNQRNVEEASEEDSVFPVEVQNGEYVGQQYETTKQETEFSPALNIRCTALFTYEFTNIVAVSRSLKARNYRDEEGYIPQNYVEIADEQDFVSSIQPAPASFSSVDYTSESFSSPPDNTQIDGATDDVVPVDELNNSPPALSGERFCQALFDYEAMCDEELSFTEGQIIRISKKVVHDVDDGWWEGEIDGRFGIFPSLVVKEIKADEESQTPSVGFVDLQLIPLRSRLNESLESFQNSFEAVTQELQKPLQQPAIVVEYAIENQDIGQLQSSRTEGDIPPVEQDDTIESTSDQDIIALQSTKTEGDIPPVEQDDAIESTSEQDIIVLQSFKTEGDIPPVEQDDTIESPSDQDIIALQSSKTEGDIPPVHQSDPIESTDDQDVCQIQHFRTEEDNPLVNQNYYTYSTADQDVSQEQSSRTEEDVPPIEQNDCIDSTADQDASQEQSSRTEEDIIPDQQDDHIDSTTDQDVSQEQSSRTEEDAPPIEQDDPMDSIADHDIIQQESSRIEEDVSPVEQDDHMDSATVANHNVRNVDKEVQEYKSEGFSQDGVLCQASTELTDSVENNGSIKDTEVTHNI
ncbi:F-BAR and double SH3 domains protein 2-like, partial [Limulus polyphemus]|uniref:F-BAR and double SH3 domains protein 2-like n=1 Tax=Limulus polyphemus TaxID=6850 RepID=A0ABM1BMQ9_LIMPO